MFADTAPTQGNHFLNTCPPASRIFHGRQQILDTMQQFFSQDLGKQRVYVLYGLGGVGKTQTALKFIEQSQTHLRFSITCLIDTSTRETIDTSFKNIALKLKIGETAEAAIQRFTAKKEEWLLLFDNADEPSIDLNKFFPQCNHGNIIITSRNPGLCVYAGADTHVDNMEESDAVVLLLKGAALENIPKNRVASTAIVKELACLPLAIIQAGAFIAKSRNLEGYLTVYSTNKSRLLSEKPAQSHDSYAWTVYTTWQMSFDKLSPLAARLLQLCSWLHYKEISEEFFMNASKYQSQSAIPAEQDLQGSIMAYSLMEFEPDQKLFSMHPLVHDWCQRSIVDQEACHSSIVGILGMFISCIPHHDTKLHSLKLVPHIDALLHGETELFPDFSDQYAHIYAAAGHHTKAEKLRILVIEKHRKILGDDHQYTLRAMHYLSETYFSLGQLEKAQMLLVRVLEIQRQVLGYDHPETLESMSDLAAVYHDLGQFENAMQVGILAFERKKQILGEDHPSTLETMSNLASIYSVLDQLEEALKLDTAILERRRQSLGEDHPDTLWSGNNLSAIYMHLGKLEEANKLQVSVVEKYIHVLGRDHPDTLRSLSNHAKLYRYLGNFAQAQKLNMSVFEKCSQLLGKDHPETLICMYHMAETCIDMGQFEEALQLGMLVLEKRKQILGTDHVHTARSMGQVGATYNFLGLYEEALKLNILSVEKQRHILGDEHSDTLKSMANLAITYGGLGKFEDAKELQVCVLEKRRKTAGEDDPRTLRTIVHLAAMYHHLGNTEEANKLALPAQQKLIGDQNPCTLLAMGSLTAAYRISGKVKEADDLDKLFPTFVKADE
ncbi:P-loop containing nucleoside triphosphate hydrolase protein [Mycena pura]|uniref:P-loop containing nucleoside triphosphate hydrolase protein n=1 Tax=Mycena pura TaxID=153505 RepID=A0AAD6Y0Y4_9AGAR|nr:P-loop containing nucleoside triphosphate hydrolase protein [Mycena pura]